MSNTTGQVYLGTILLEKNRWPDSPATRFSLGEKLCRGRAALPSVQVSDWAARAQADGFDGLELWENHALLADDEEFGWLAEMPLPVAIYNSYFGLDDEDDLWREVAAEAVLGVRATGVKYNFGPDPAQGRPFVAERVQLLRDHGFGGSFTVEFTEGIAWGPADPPLETLYASAVADLNMLREVWNA